MDGQDRQDKKEISIFYPVHPDQKTRLAMLILLFGLFV